MDSMEQVRESVRYVLGSNESLITAVIDRLKAVGVTCEGDLFDIQVSDLPPSVLLPIPARKLIRHWSKSADENNNPVNNSTLLQQQTSSQSLVSVQLVSPLLVPVTPTSLPTHPLIPLDSNELNWASKCNVKTSISEMIKQGHLTEQTAARHLSEGKALPHSERNEIVRFLSSCILKVCSTPCRKGLSLVAESLVTVYPQLRDEIYGTVVGPGYISVRNQLENRLAYLKRPLSNNRRAASARRRLVNEDELETIEPKKRLRDGYGCVDFLPVDWPDGETEDSLKIKHSQLKAIHQSGNGNWNGGEVSELMSLTYGLQRQDLVGCRPMSVRDIQFDWPFLCEPRWMLEHLQRLLGISVLVKLETNLMAKKRHFSTILKTCGSNHEGVESKAVTS